MSVGRFAARVETNPLPQVGIYEERFPPEKSHADPRELEACLEERGISCRRITTEDMSRAARWTWKWS